MQRAPDCDMVLVHDDDLLRIDNFGDNKVDKQSHVIYFYVLIYSVTGKPSSRRTDGSPQKIPAGDTAGPVW